MSDLDKTKESLESKKNQEKDLKWKFIKEFSKTFLAWKDKTLFINEIIKSENITDSKIIKRKLELFQAKSDDVEIKNFDLSKINIFDLKRLVWKDYLKLKNSRLSLRELTLKEFCISSKEFDNNLSEEIYKLSISEIEKLLNSETELSKFINEKIWFELEKREDLFPFNFLWYDDSQKLHILNNLSPQNLRREVVNILNDMSNWRIIDSDIKTLFQTNLFTLDQKQLLIKTYIPNVDLQKLVNFWIYTQDEAENKKKLILEELTKDNGFYIAELEDSLSLSDIKISTNDINLTEESIFSLSQNIWFKNLERNIEELKESIDELKEDKIKNSKTKWPQTLKSVIKELSNNPNIKDIKKFTKGNIFKLTKKDNNWITQELYIKVIDIDEVNKKIILQDIWTWEAISLTEKTEPRELDYFEFLDLSNLDNVSMSFFTNDEIESKVEEWIIDKIDLKQYKKEDLDDINNYPIYKNAFFSSKQDELNHLIDLHNQWMVHDSDLWRLDDIQSFIDDWRVTDETLLDFLNFQELLSELDKIDSGWKNLWLKKWLFLETKDWWVHEISGISDWEIVVRTSWIDEEPIDYETFLMAFKNLDTKRVKKIDNFSEVIDSFKETDNKNWWKLTFEDWKIISNDSNNKEKNKDKVVEYFVSDKEDDIIRVHEISWDNITVSFWERKSDHSGNEKLYIKWANKETFNLNEFKTRILWDSKYNFRPSWETWKKIENEEESSWNKFKSSFLKRLFNRSSILDLLAWSKIFLHSIEESLKKWNDLKAANFALSIWWFLPEELRADLKIKVESEEAESMEKALKWLWSVDSPDAVNRIKWWLSNRDTPEYKKEAGLIFMLSKYGHLTAKWALYEYRWKYLWYEALGWKVWDDFFNEVKNESLSASITFSEEYLVHKLLKKQCWESPFKWHKRRSRLHKEYENKWSSWISDEVEKWYKDASAKRKSSQMIYWWHDEAKWGTTSNAIWWYKKAIERGWELEEMNEWFFCLLYSGAAFDLDQKTYLNARSLWQSGMPIITTRFFSTVPEMKLFNDTVLRLSSIIWEQYPDKFPNIYSDAKEIHEMVENKKWKEKDRLGMTINFWKKYWKVLSNSLYMKHIWDSEFSKTDKTVLLRKDNDPILQEYFNKVREFTWEDAFKKDFMDDACWDAWVSWLDTKKMVVQYLYMDTGGWYRDKNMWPKMWNWISNDIKSTFSKTFSDNPNEDLLLKRKYLRIIFRDLLSGILEVWWFRKDMLMSYNNSSSDIWQDLNSWWVVLQDYMWHSPSNVLAWEADNLIDNAIDNILSWRKVSTWNSFDSILESVKTWVWENLKSK